jgi:hypothetical protein
MSDPLDRVLQRRRTLGLLFAAASIPLAAGLPAHAAPQPGKCASATRNTAR